MDEKAAALLIRLQFELAKSKAHSGGIAGGPGSEEFVKSFLDYWNNLEKRVLEIEDCAKQSSK